MMPSMSWIRPDHHLAQFVHRGGLGPGDHVVGAGDALGGHHAVEALDGPGHGGRPSDLGLDEDVGADGHVHLLGRAVGAAAHHATARLRPAYHADMGVRERGDQFRRLIRSAVHDLFDQRSPFGRLALTHVLMTAGDTMFAVSLAGSLFFSISPTAAKDKVLLYLLLTMGPFAVVAPGPRPAHRPEPGRPAGHGGHLGTGPGGAVPVRRPGHPLAPAVPRGVRDAGAVEGLPGHQGCAGPRDGRPRDGRAGRRPDRRRTRTTTRAADPGSPRTPEPTPRPTGPRRSSTSTTR